MFTLCSTAESVLEAAQVLAAAEYVILDCEGRDLGCASGALSLISLGTPHASIVYLFDVITLPHCSLQLLFNTVLSHTQSARAKIKVVWDGRMDYAELFYSYTCPIENVLDLQLADVLSRDKRGLNDWNRIGRFSRRAFPMSEVRKLQLEEVHILNGMDGAAGEHGIKGVASKNESIKKLHTDNLSDIWMQRPLSNELLGYAADDITRIAALYDHFQQHGYLEPVEYLRELSSRYVSMHRRFGKPDQENIFLRGPFLPLSISLLASSRRVLSVVESSKECSGCKRTMLERHFPFEQVAVKKKGRKVVDDEKDRPRSPMCKVCTFILTKAKYVEKQKAEKAKLQIPVRDG